MYISCNLIKKHLTNTNNIDWVNVWDKFTISSAEVEHVAVVGNDIEKIVVAKILEVEKHPKKDKYTICKVDIGEKIITIVTAATNVYKNMVVPCALPGGKLKGMEIGVREIANIPSEGVMCSEKELGISDADEGIMTLSNDYEIGKDIKDYIPIDDVVVEIDNKSLTNRPDMWGHYGIAREIAAITEAKLLPLELYSITNNLKDLNIEVIDKENCNRYSGIKIDNITAKNSLMEMQVILYHCGMRSISLLVDLTNYIMLEMGQPLHAFDSEKIDKIVVRLSDNNTKFTTLDKVERNISNNNLMICNSSEALAIAGIMGGLKSEVSADTTSIVLEAANFDATSIRKTATELGLRTEASARYEKALDPNMTVTAILRFLKLLADVDSNITIASNLTDVYSNMIAEKQIVLDKKYLASYMGTVIEDGKVVEILNSLEFKVTVDEENYNVLVPTFRSTKDITNKADIIEEIARIYGYNNLEPKPLKLDLNIINQDKNYQLQYEIKRLLSEKYDLSEVHSYLWYDTNFLKRLDIIKNSCTKVVNKIEDNLLRDDLTMSLLQMASENIKYKNRFGIYEIGSVIRDNKENKTLNILLANENKLLENEYSTLKNIISNILAIFKNKRVDFKKEDGLLDYLNSSLTLGIYVDNKKMGYLSTINKNITNKINKKLCFVVAEINIDEFININKESILYNAPSKYPSVNLDYTLILNKETNYNEVCNILNKINNELLISYELINRYEDDNNRKYTIRFVIGSKEKTLTQEEIKLFFDRVINVLKENNIAIVC
jgi:phenylalanyl-tRNA synthetase beta chain